MNNSYLHFQAKVILCLSLFTLASLACGGQSTLPVYESTTPTHEVSIFVTSTPEMAQIVGSWNLRTSPGESSQHIITLTDVEVQLIDCVSASGGVWCKVQSGGVTGWVNKRGLKFSPLTGIK